MRKIFFIILLISGLCLQTISIFLASKSAAFVGVGVLGSMLIFLSIYKLINKPIYKLTLHMSLQVNPKTNFNLF